MSDNEPKLYLLSRMVDNYRCEIPLHAAYHHSELGLIILLMSAVRANQYFLLYLMGIINTLVLFMIGFKRT